MRLRLAALMGAWTTQHLLPRCTQAPAFDGDMADLPPFLKNNLPLLSRLRQPLDGEQVFWMPHAKQVRSSDKSPAYQVPADIAQSLLQGLLTSPHKEASPHSPKEPVDCCTRAAVAMLGSKAPLVTSNVGDEILPLMYAGMIWTGPAPERVRELLQKVYCGARGQWGVKFESPSGKTLVFYLQGGSYCATSVDEFVRFGEDELSNWLATTPQHPLVPWESRVRSLVKIYADESSNGRGGVKFHLFGLNDEWGEEVDRREDK